MRNAISLLTSLALVFVVAYLGSQGSMIGLQSWYMTARKPVWNPPSWVFAPVWTVLYLLMGIAAWMIWRSDHEGRSRALILFAIQLALNGLWSWIFFAWHQPGFAFYELIVLWIAIALTLVAFWRVRRTAGWLLVPYLCWVSFAGALNYTIWKMNV